MGSPYSPTGTKLGVIGVKGKTGFHFDFQSLKDNIYEYD